MRIFKTQLTNLTLAPKERKEVIFNLGSNNSLKLKDAKICFDFKTQVTPNNRLFFSNKTGMLSQIQFYHEGRMVLDLQNCEKIYKRNCELDYEKSMYFYGDLFGQRQHQGDVKDTVQNIVFKADIPDSLESHFNSIHQIKNYTYTEYNSTLGNIDISYLNIGIPLYHYLKYTAFNQEEFLKYRNLEIKVTFLEPEKFCFFQNSIQEGVQIDFDIDNSSLFDQNITLQNLTMQVPRSIAKSNLQKQVREVTHLKTILHSQINSIKVKEFGDKAQIMLFSKNPVYQRQISEHTINIEDYTQNENIQLKRLIQNEEMILYALDTSSQEYLQFLQQAGIYDSYKKSVQNILLNTNILAVNGIDQQINLDIEFKENADYECCIFVFTKRLISIDDQGQKMMIRSFILKSFEYMEDDKFYCNLCKVYVKKVSIHAHRKTKLHFNNIGKKKIIFKPHSEAVLIVK